jgi:hypothetical protein
VPVSSQDWCLDYIIEEDGSARRRVAVARQIPDKEELASRPGRAFARRTLSVMRVDPSAVQRHSSEVVPSISHDQLQYRIATNEEHLEDQPGGWMCAVPWSFLLVARRKNARRHRHFWSTQAQREFGDGVW